MNRLCGPIKNSDRRLERSSAQHLNYPRFSLEWGKVQIQKFSLQINHLYINSLVRLTSGLLSKLKLIFKSLKLSFRKYSRPNLSTNFLPILQFYFLTEINLLKRWFRLWQVQCSTSWMVILKMTVSRTMKEDLQSIQPWVMENATGSSLQLKLEKYTLFRRGRI